MIDTCDGSVSGAVARAARRQGVDRRRETAADPIGTQRVDRDEQDVGLLRRSGGLPAAARGQQQARGRSGVSHDNQYARPSGRACSRRHLARLERARVVTLHTRRDAASRQGTKASRHEANT
jgi:hypothetical protein